MSSIPPPTSPPGSRWERDGIPCTDAGSRGSLPKARIVDWLALETRLIRISDGSDGRQQKWGACDGQHTRAWLVRRGSVDIESAAGPAHVPAGQWVIATPGREEMAFSRDAKTILLSFDAVWPDGESLFHESATRSFSAARYPQMEETAMALLSYVEKRFPGNMAALPNAIADLHVFNCLKQRVDLWLEAFLAAMTADGAVPTRLGIADPRIQRAVRLLDSWPLEAPLDRERVAREAGIAVAQFERLFNAQLHLTPSRYLDRRRIDRACRSLSGSDTTIKAIAFGLGFHSEAHFSHWFKQHQHVCPRSFRQARIGRQGAARESRSLGCET